jgi:hypothetical protein
VPLHRLEHVAQPRIIGDARAGSRGRSLRERVGFRLALVSREDPHLFVAGVADERVVAWQRAKQAERLIRPAGVVEQQRQKQGRVAVLRIGVASDLDQPDRRAGALHPSNVGAECGQHLAQRLDRSVDRFSGLPSGEDALARGGRVGADAFDNRARPRLVPGGEEAIGKRQAKVGLPIAGIAERAAGERLGIGGPLELEQDQRGVEVAAVGRAPCRDQRSQEAQIDAPAAASGKPLERPVRAPPLELLGDHQQLRIAAELGRRHARDELEREVHAAGADRFAERLGGDLALPRLALREAGEKQCGARVVAVHRRRPRLQIHPRRVVGRGSGLEPRGRRNRRDQHQRERRSAEPFTCSDNWGLRRLRV